jgi:hypothetical protein
MGDGGGLVKSWCGELDEVEYRADVDSAMTDLHILPVTQIGITIIQVAFN